MNRAVFLSLSFGWMGAAEAINFPPQPCVPGQPSFWCGGKEPINASPACPGDRWVGFQTGTTPVACAAAAPAAGGFWAVRKLFPAAPGTLPQALERFCVYEWNPAWVGSAPKPTALPNSAAMRLERDCRVVTPLYEPSLATARELSAVHDDAVDHPYWVQNPGLSQIRVAVIDGAPDEIGSGLPSGPAQGHTRAMGSLIQQMARRRGPGDIWLGESAYVVSYRGLTLNPVDGEGTVGYPSAVAEAMTRAVQDFQFQSQQPRMVINLSLGWDPIHGGEFSPTLRTTYLATLLVVQWAADLDILVIAAAGNRGRLDGGLTAMYPAAWEGDTMDLYGESAVFYHPSIYAVGGVDFTDEALGVARLRGEPRLVAPASYVAPLARSAVGTVEGPTSLRSGTSLAAASVSGAAALVWSANPNISPEFLMHRIYQFAEPVRAAADFEHPPQSWSVRRLNTCRVLRNLHPFWIAPCVMRPAYEDISPSYSALIELEWPGFLAGATDGGATVLPPPLPKAPAESTFRPWVLPQPGSNTCVPCTLIGDTLVGKLDLEESVIVDAAILRAEPCDGWCDPEIGGVLLSLPTDAQAKVVIPNFAPYPGLKLTLELHLSNNEGSLSTLSEVTRED